jgi:NAD(P)-dependent dehydrogenase (short-subunit alcohol dehydrogenase family)
VNATPSLELAGKVVLVTGASRGLGLTIASGLAEAGATVALAARPTSLPALTKCCEDIRRKGGGGELLALAGEIECQVDCERIVAHVIAAFGRLDVLFNNAGLGMSLLGSHVKRTIPFYEVPVETWKRIVDTNVNGTFLMSRSAIPHMLERGWGRIVNLSTSLSTMVRPGFSPYGPTKSAIDVMSTIWSKELAGSGVTVNSLLPGGPCDTDMVPFEDFPDRAKLIRPEVMVPPALWLASERSNAVTGMRITANLWDAEAGSATSGAAGAPRAAIAPATWQ